MNYQPSRNRPISAALLALMAITLLSFAARATAQTVDPLSDADGEAGGMVAENSPAGTAVGITAQATGSTNYTLTESAGGLFAINEQSGIVTVAMDMLDHEAFSSHAIVVQASNNTTAISTISFTIQVTDVAEPIRHIADIDFSPNRISYGSAQGDTVGITARAVDPDQGSTVAYSLSEDSTGLFTIGQRDGVVTLTSNNYDPEQSYPIEVTARSNDRTSSTAQFTVRRDEPVRIAPSPTASTVREGESQEITFSFAKAELELKDISAGNSHSCGITPDNEAVCWGGDVDGQSTPPSDRKFIVISAGRFHNCGITPDNEAVCWGSNNHNQSTPPSGGKFIAISAGNSHSCGITPDNEAVCWGQNNSGSTMPPSGRKFIAISAGGDHSCGITPDNEAVCWGQNASGSTMPPSGRKFTAVSAGSDHSCGITPDNDAICWGNPGGGRNMPPSDKKFIAVSAGGRHSCGITPGNEAVCWGRNNDKQSAPPPSRKFIAISAGFLHTCAITTDNEAVCWGDNENGQSTPPQISPTAADSITITATISDAGRGQISLSGQAIIPAGETQATLAVTVTDDGIEESTADYTISLSAAGHAALEEDALTITVPVDGDDTQAIGDIDNTADIIAENSPTGSEVGIIVHADNAANYTLTDSADGRFAINDNGLVTVAADGGKLNFEDTITHTITAQAGNADRSALRLTIRVSNVNEITLRDGDGRNNLVRASTSAVALGMALEASHSDNAPITAWELRQTVDVFELTQAAGSSTQGLRIKADAENLSSHTGATTMLSVIARTAHDEKAETFTITFTAQEPVLVGELEDADGRDNEVAEGSPAGSTVGITIQADNAANYTLTDNADGRFAINSSGLVTVADGNQLDFEDATTHSITVEASSVNDRRTTMPLIIRLTNKNEIALTDADPAINTALASTAVTAVEGLTLRAVHADDAPITGWEIAAQTVASSPSAPVDLFEFSEPAKSSDTRTLRIKADANLAPITTPNTITLTVSARTAFDETSEDFDIRLLPATPAEGLIADSDPAPNALPEDAAASSRTGITLSVAGKDGGSTVSYTLTDSNDGLFLADTMTGIVTLRGSLNYERSTRHTIIAQAMFGDGPDPITRAFTIDVTNVNEITLTDTDPDINTALASTAVTAVEGLTLRAVHADGAPIIGWEITAQTGPSSPSAPVDLFEFSEPAKSSDTRALRIKTGATFAPITTPSTITLTVSARTAFDETDEDFDIQLFPDTSAAGIRLRVRVYLEGALE